jgi:spore germination cell wall hydrolase CwlJ-like protein
MYTLLIAQAKNVAALLFALSASFGVIIYQYEENEPPEVIALDAHPVLESYKVAKINPTPTEALAQNLYFEARGEGKEGMIAVANVVQERANHDLEANAIKVIYAPNQFSWIGEVDEIKDEKMYELAEKIAGYAMAGTLRKVVPNADHYYNPSKCNPAWASKMGEVKVVGNHRFLNSKAKPAQKAEVKTNKPKTKV